MAVAPPVEPIPLVDRTLLVDRTRLVDLTPLVEPAETHEASALRRALRREESEDVVSGRAVPRLERRPADGS